MSTEFVVILIKQKNWVVVMLVLIDSDLYSKIVLRVWESVQLAPSYHSDWHKVTYKITNMQIMVHTMA